MVAVPTLPCAQQCSSTCPGVCVSCTTRGCLCAGGSADPDLQPYLTLRAAVLIDVDTLATLPERELASGLSEVVKYGLIRDPALFGWLEANMERLLQRDPQVRRPPWERDWQPCCVRCRRAVSAQQGRAPPRRP